MPTLAFAKRRHGNGSRAAARINQGVQMHSASKISSTPMLQTFAAVVTHSTSKQRQTEKLHLSALFTCLLRPQSALSLFMFSQRMNAPETPYLAANSCSGFIFT
jgi:hypothetical protein